MREDQEEYEEYILWREHNANKRSGPPARVLPPEAHPGTPLVEKMLDKAPSWIMMLVAATIGYATLNTRVSILEGQANLSIADREKLHNDVSTLRDGFSGIKSDLAEIKTKVTDLAERRNGK